MANYRRVTELHYHNLIGGRVLEMQGRSEEGQSPSAVIYMQTSPAESIDVHWKGNVGGDNDMEVCAVISPARLHRQP